MITKKKVILFGIGAVLLVFFSSFLVEYYGFGHQVRTLEKDNAGILTVQNAAITSENFSLAEQQGTFVSQTENASLVLNTQGKYVQNLEFALGDKPNYAVSVSFLDPKTQQEVVLENKVQKSMRKNSFTFLSFAVFRIESNPAQITISASIPQTVISNIKIDNSYHFNYQRWFFLVAVELLFLIFIVIRKKIEEKPEVGFLAVVLICGTLLSFSEPLEYVSWDEAIHYARADDYSLKNIFSNNLVDIFGKTNSVPASYSLKEQTALNAYFDDLKPKATKNKKQKPFSLLKFSLVDFYTQLVCLPSGFALMLGRIAHLPNHWIFMLGRWINVWIFAGLVFLAMRKLKTGKMLMAVVALLPTSIFLASNYGYDFWVTGFVMLGFAYFFSELQQPEKKITKREVVIMLGAFFIGLGPKAIYFPLILLLFLLKKEKFSSLVQYQKFMLASIFTTLFVLGSFLVPFLVSGPGSGDHRGGDGVNATEQVHFILSNPLAYAKILGNFMLGYLNPMNAGGFMTFFAYLGSFKGHYLLLAVIIFVILTDKNKFDKQIDNWKLRGWVFAGCFSTVVLISTALYIAFTPVASEIIAGVQPRYLIPLIFPLLFVLGSSRLKNPFNKNVYNLLIFGIVASVFFWGAWELIIRNYY
ncbi:MAG: DUF2142 domain-containing protein [Candidatus Moraniibacteriota bacterium]